MIPALPDYCQLTQSTKPLVKTARAQWRPAQRWRVDMTQMAWGPRFRLSMEGAAMLIMYRGFELVPVKDGEKWQAQISSCGRRIAVTPPHGSEEPAMSEARKIVDGIRNSRRSARPQAWPASPAP
jgi:hypothetical protein